MEFPFLLTLKDELAIDPIASRLHFRRQFRQADISAGADQMPEKCSQRPGTACRMLAVVHATVLHQFQ
jgi:hypothetical protein